MIQAIKELNFPPYATLSQATATMHDMGDRTITADIKIDGAITPDFSYDWEVEFKGEKYIQPLRKPQGSKGDKSSMSTINLTFYHWAIYQLKRYFFVELASTQAGTAFADKYIVPLSVNLGEFVVAFSNVLSYYFPDGDIYIDLNPDWVFDAERKYIDINNTYLWDVLQKTYGLFGVRWVMERDTNGKYAIRMGYPAGELTHIFEYGFEGGLLNIERQVQNANIRNKILGRGGSKNIPYLYFKDYDKYPLGGDGNQGMIPDPDAIPELSNIYFTELRDSNFRSYVQGWKTNANRQLVEGDVLDEFDAERAETDYAYMRGATDEKFDPVEYVKDDASIAKYGELVGKLENNEEIFPSLQGMEIDITVPGGKVIRTRADEVVAVQEVVTDRIASDEQEVKNDIKLEAKSETSHGAGKDTFVAAESTITVSSNEVVVPDGYEGTLFDVPTIKYTLEWKERIKQYMQYKQYYEGDKLSGKVYSKGDGAFPSVRYKVVDVVSGKEVHPVNLPEGRYRIDYTLKFPEVTLSRGIVHAQQTPNGLGQTERVSVYWLKRLVTASAAIICKSFNGDVILNKVDGVSISKSVSMGANSKSTVSISGSSFSVPSQGALMVDVPISVTPAATTTYSEKTVKVVNAKTNEIVPAINIPKGEYKLLVDVTLTNESSSAKTLKVELLPAYLYFVDNTEKWEPTFDVWIKNIFNTKKSDYDSEAAYVEGVWSPLRTEDEMVLTFSSGNLSGHDGWEFKVKKDGIAYDNSRVIVDANGNEVRSEWRLTLIKSDAELETIKKYIPYKDFNAKAGDTFFFTGIILPHQYVLGAEKDVTSWKEDNLTEVKDIKPQWVISLDKVRAHREDADRLVDLLHVGAVLTLKDHRFTKSVGERQILQSITFEWHETSLLPAIDVVLSDKVTTSLSTTAMLQGKVDALARQVGGLSNLEQIVRKVGDLLYLRKDGFADTSFSPTKFADTVSSQNFRPGAIGGSGWGAYTDENGNSVIEADKLFIRNEMQVNSLIVNQIAALGGTKILSAADMTISAVEPVVLDDGSVGERCFFDTKGSSKSNLFAIDDIAYSNVFDSENLELKYYKRRVIDIGVDYITLSTTDKDGEGSPQEGDVIVQFGNFTDTARQSFIIIEPLNGGKIEVYAGVNSFDLTDCNMTGLGVNPSTKEAFLYGYGDFFFGDRKREDNYITFQQRKGDNKKKLFIKANVELGADSTGLSNLSEWQGLQSQVNTLDGDLEAAESVINNKIATINTTIGNLQDQIDGVVDNYFKEGDPSTTKSPVTDWIEGIEDKIQQGYELLNHVGDTYTNISTTGDNAGRSWRWCECEDTTAYTDYIEVTRPNGSKAKLHWHPIADTDALKALEMAKKAQDTADGKRRNFIDTPKPPYDEGDLWSDSTTGDLKVCVNAKKDGQSYSASDWEKATKYTDGANMQNLLANSGEVLVSQYERYKTFLLPIKVNSGDKFTFKAEEISRLLGTATNVRVHIDDGSSNYVGEAQFINVGEGETITNPTITFTIKEGVSNSKAYLSIYSASTYNASGENSVRYSKISLVKGDTPMSVWQDYQGDFALENILTVGEKYEGSITQYAYFVESLPMTVNSGEQYTFCIENSEIISGADSNGIFNVAIDNTNSTNISNAVNVTIGTKSWGVLTINEGYVNQAARLIVWKNDNPPHNSTIRLSKLSLVKGSTPLMVWKENPNVLKNTIADWANDQKFAPSEISGLKTEKKRIEEERNDIIAQYIDAFGNNSSTAYTNYSTAYTNYVNVLGTAIDAFTALSDKTKSVSVPANFTTYLNNYYEKKTAIITVISDKVRKDISDIGEQAAKVDDYKYLDSVFGQITEGDVVLGKMMGVGTRTDKDTFTVEGFMNGSETFKGTDSEGKLMIAAGVPTSGGTLAERAKNATTRIYEKGKIVTNDIEAKDGKIGNFQIKEGRNLEYIDETTKAEMTLNEIGVAFYSNGRNNAGAYAHLGNGCGGYVVLQVVADPTKAPYCYGPAGNIHTGIHVMSDQANIMSEEGMFYGFRPRTDSVEGNNVNKPLTVLHHTEIAKSSATYTLPSIPVQGQCYRIIKTRASYTITIKASGSMQIYDLISNSSKAQSFTIPSNVRMVEIVYDGATTWYVDGIEH